MISHDLLRGIKDELGRMNGMLVAILAMVTEMNAMNRQMSVMTRGVGSTMGRIKNPTSKNTITTIDSESYDSIGGQKHSLDHDTISAPIPACATVSHQRTLDPGFE